MKTKNTEAIKPSLADAPRRYVPLGDRVLLERAKPEETTAGGIILPVNHAGAEEINVSVVVEVGPDVPEQIRPGAWVTHLPYGTELIRVNGHEFYTCRVDDLLGLLVK